MVAPIRRLSRAGDGPPKISLAIRSTASIAMAMAMTGLVAADAPPAAAATPAVSVTVSGHGYGHGRGMGQFGAIGYALAGTTYQTTLAHYYGGTSLTTLANPNPSVRVVLTWNDGAPISMTSQSPFVVAGHSFAANTAASLVLTPAGTWNLYSAVSCSGPFTTPIATGIATTSAVATPASLAPSATTSSVLQLCSPSGLRPYRGQIQAASYSGSARTVNVLPLDQYLWGVVPSEMPGSWGQMGAAGPQGQPWGFQALETQAVAARSYEQASPGRYGYADICDSTYCQVYSGMSLEWPAATAAVNDTSGQVMEYPSGAVASTEFSASTGGWTAGGAFPAVVDSGDSVCIQYSVCNPYHNWTQTIPASTIDNAWPQIGSLTSISITGRNGYGDMGGRVTSMVVTGTTGSVTLTGNDFAWALGLGSNWFSTTVNVPPASYRLVTAGGHVYPFGSAVSYGSGPPNLSSPVVAIADTPDGKGYWVVTARGNVYNFGDASWFGSLATANLPAPVVGFAPDPTGKGYWLVTAKGNVFNFGNATWSGSLAATPLSSPIAGVAAGPQGGYWLMSRAGTVWSYGGAPAYGSASSASPFVDITAAPSGQGYWLTTAAGNIYNKGNTPWVGSLAGSALPAPVVALASTPDSKGYWVVTTKGNVYNLGDANWAGSLAGQTLASPVASATAP